MMNALRLIGMYLMLCSIFGFLMSFLPSPTVVQIVFCPFFFVYKTIATWIINAYGGNILTDWMVKLWADVVGRFFALVICFILGYVFVRFSEPKVVVMR
jgi:hypothetical protein